MKKMFSLVLIALMFLGVIFFTASTVFSQLDDPEDMPGGSGGTTLWYKTRDACPNAPTKTEYSCDAGGTEQCTVQNCP